MWKSQWCSQRVMAIMTVMIKNLFLWQKIKKQHRNHLYKITWRGGNYQQLMLIINTLWYIYRFGKVPRLCWNIFSCLFEAMNMCHKIRRFRDAGCQSLFFNSFFYISWDIWYTYCIKNSIFSTFPDIVV